jgi:hypothetical protein
MRAQSLLAGAILALAVASLSLPLRVNGAVTTQTTKAPPQEQNSSPASELTQCAHDRFLEWALTPDPVTDESIAFEIQLIKKVCAGTDGDLTSLQDATALAAGIDAAMIEIRAMANEILRRMPKGRGD